MRHYVTGLALVVLLAPSADAFKAVQPIETVLRDYDIVITGTMGDLDWLEPRSRCVVTISVSDVIWGDAEPGDTLQFEWSGYWESAPDPDQRHGERIFLLRHSGETLEIESDYMLLAQTRGRIEDMLEDLPIRIESPRHAPGDNEWGVVDLVYLNAAEHARSFSGIRYEDGLFSAASESTRLDFSIGAGKNRQPVLPRDGAFAVDPSIPDVVVPGRGVARFQIDLRTLFEVPSDGTRSPVTHVSFEVHGAGQGHERWFMWD